MSYTVCDTQGELFSASVGLTLLLWLASALPGTWTQDRFLDIHPSAQSAQSTCHHGWPSRLDRWQPFCLFEDSCSPASSEHRWTTPLAHWKLQGKVLCWSQHQVRGASKVKEKYSMWSGQHNTNQVLSYCIQFTLSSLLWSTCGLLLKICTVRTQDYYPGCTPVRPTVQHTCTQPAGYTVHIYILAFECIHC